MVHKKENGYAELLGELLRQQREKSGYSLEAVGETTKIPITTLKAMEADEYDKLPAEAFALGFYSIYAKFLQLDVNSVLELYHVHNQHSKRKKRQTATPSQLHSQINTMATPPAIGVGTILGFGLVLLVIVGALICWSTDWNPASYLSEKIRSGEEKPILDRVETDHKEKDLVTGRYYLQAYFPSITKVTVTQDNDKPENYLFQSGDTRSWVAERSITMILPEKVNVILTVNGLQYPLPPPQYGLVTVKIPSQ